MKESTARRLLRTHRNLGEELARLSKAGTADFNKLTSIQRQMSALASRLPEARATMDRYNKIQEVHEAAKKDVVQKLIETYGEDGIKDHTPETAAEALLRRARNEALKRNRGKDLVALGKVVPIHKYESMGNKEHVFSSQGRDLGKKPKLPEATLPEAVVQPTVVDGYRICIEQDCKFIILGEGLHCPQHTKERSATSVTP